MKLNEAKVGATVRIDAIEESPMKQRLMTMGIAIRLRAYNLALRRDDADKIIVTEQ